MKIYIYFLLLFLTQVYSQNYSFDFVTKYKTADSDRTFESIVYSNSLSEEYILKLYYNSEGKLSGWIMDQKNNYFHYFDIDVINEKEENQLIFNYINSKRFNSNNSVYQHEFEYIETPIDSLKSKLIINSYKNKKRKKPFRTYELEVIHFESNKFSNFRWSIHHLYEGNKNFNPRQNYLVQSYIYKNTLGETSTWNLVEYDNVKINITVKDIVLKQ
ncbi:hypothetical protein [Flavobacterium sp.]|uniref:hypothetical protein n=1 Tax=Flavobacterium sp. TaxID=239 RepID=UPI00352754B2